MNTTGPFPQLPMRLQNLQKDLEPCNAFNRSRAEPQAVCPERLGGSRLETPLNLTAEFLDLVLLVLSSLSMTSRAGSSSEHKDEDKHTCDSRLGSSTAYVSSSRSLIGFLLALLGQGILESSAVSAYLNVDDSGGKLFL